MSEHTPSVLDLVFGYTAAQMINVAARLSIADRLAERDMSSTELARDSGTDAASMFRLLRGLACFGIVTQAGADRFALGPAGLALRADDPHSIRSMVMLLCASETWRSWGELEYSVRTGEPAFEQVNGMSNFEFMAKHPEQSATFNAAMAEYTRAALPRILAQGDFSRFGSVVDVGGGDGTLLAAILSEVPGLRGVLFDLPAGLSDATRTLAAAGVADRCRVVGGDFFDSVPEGSDAYVLKSVLHDWNDRRATQILGACRRAMPDNGTILAIEPVLPSTIDSMEHVGVVMSDVNMLVNTGGRERTAEEFEKLYAGAGFTLTRITGEGADFRVIEGVPA